MRNRVRHGGVTMVAAIGAVLMLAMPAAATHHTVDLEMHSGRVSIGGVVMFEHPGGGIVGCPPPVWGLDGTVDDVAGTATVHLNVAEPFQNALFGLNFLVISGTGTGVYNPVTKHVNVTIAFTFQIQAYTGSTGAPPCTPGAIKCAGTGHLNLTVQLPNLPVNPGATVYVNSTSGSIITVVPSCPFPLNLVMRPGAALTLAASPNIQPPQPGAHYTTA